MTYIFWFYALLHFSGNCWHLMWLMCLQCTFCVCQVLQYIYRLQR